MTHNFCGPKMFLDPKCFWPDICYDAKPKLGNKRNRNLPAETRNFPKPKFGSGFVPAHFQASWFRFRYLVLKFLDFLVIQEVLPWIPGLTRNFLVKPGTSWLTQEILREFCEESPLNQILTKKNVCFLVIFRQFLVFLVSVFFFHTHHLQCLNAYKMQNGLQGAPKWPTGSG